MPHHDSKKTTDQRRGWRRLRLDSVRSIIKDKSIAQLDTYSREIEIVNRLLLACDDKLTGRYTTLSYFYDDAIAAFWRQRDARKMLSPAALTPDELLYANGPAMWVPPRLLACTCVTAGTSVVTQAQVPKTRVGGRKSQAD